MQKVQDQDLARKLREKVNAFNQKSPVIPAIVTLAFIILPEIAQKLTA